VDTVAAPGGLVDKQLLEDAHLAQSGENGEQEEYDSNATHPQVDGP